MSNSHGIPQKVVEEALNVVRQQSTVPRSPAGTDPAGEPVLCAAACLAFAGLKSLKGPQSALAFRDELGRDRSFALVERTFIDLGWNVDECRQKLIDNDSASDRERKAVVTRCFLSMLDRAAVKRVCD